MSTVELDNVQKFYDETQAIKGITTAIDEGEFVALVGPSGCGKSTLLRMIAGLESISSGEIRFDGKRVNDVSPRDRNIAMVFQNYALYPHMTVRKNMGFALKQRKHPAAEIEEKVNRAARILGLEALLDRKPKALSGGQRQRVAMGRAIVRNPAVFLFDEPLSNLDAKLRSQMRTEIKSLHQQFKTTTVYVTHDQIEAMTLADRVIVMNGGRVEQEGSPLELYDRPATLFVAAFIGSPAMNFFAGEVTANHGLKLNSGELELNLPELPLQAGEQVTLGVRPEHLTLADEGWPATVSVIEPTGAETLVTANLGNLSVRIVVHTRVNLEPGDAIFLQADPDKIHVFRE